MALFKDAYSQTRATANGTEPYTWTIVDGSLPDGLTLNSGTGVISGTPTAVGLNEFTVRVTDGGIPSQTADKTFTLCVAYDNYLVTGTGVGSPAHVRMFTPAGTEEAQPHSLFAYSPSYRGGSPQVRGYEANGQFLHATNFFAYARSLHNGGDIAIGDF